MTEITDEAAAFRRALAAMQRDIRVIKAMLVAIMAGVGLLLLEMIVRACP